MKVEISIKEAAQLIKEIEQKPVKILEMVKVEMPKVLGGIPDGDDETGAHQVSGEAALRKVGGRGTELS